MTLADHSVRPDYEHVFVQSPNVKGNVAELAIANGRRSLHLRLAAARNGQRACINLASDFEFRGAIAQLEERRHGMAEVVGSSPTSSTPAPPHIVGADEFRNRLGWYMERAAAGEQFLVRRRGKPYVRVAPSTAGSA